MQLFSGVGNNSQENMYATKRSIKLRHGFEFHAAAWMAKLPRYD